MLEYTSLEIPERCKNDSLRHVEQRGEKGSCQCARPDLAGERRRPEPARAKLREGDRRVTEWREPGVSQDADRVSYGAIETFIFERFMHVPSSRRHCILLNNSLCLNCLALDLMLND
jgi:hypothetical protein